MLDVTRQEIVAFLNARGLRWREDASNRDTGHLRNRVRHEILPLIRARLNPRFGEALLRTAELVREEDLWMNALAADMMEECVRCPSDGRSKQSTLDIVSLCGQPVAARRLILRQWLAANGIPAEHVDFRTVERVLAMTGSTDGTATVHLAQGRAVVRRYTELMIGPQAVPGAPAFRVKLAREGETMIPEIGIRAVVRCEPGLLGTGGGGPGALPARASINRAAVGRKQLYVRSWRAGDRMKPLGLRGSKKLQDIFVDAKVPADRRHCVPLLECADEIIWLPGYQVSDGWQVIDPTGPALQILIERL
jgi:tRNA(Ile)-lysidine synthase